MAPHLPPSFCIQLSSLVASSAIRWFPTIHRVRMTEWCSAGCRHLLSHSAVSPPTPPPLSTLSSRLHTPLDSFGGAATGSPFSSSRLVMTTGGGGGGSGMSSRAGGGGGVGSGAVGPGGGTTPGGGLPSCRPPSAAIPLLTEIRRRIGLGLGGNNNDNGGGGPGASPSSGGPGSHRRPTAAPPLSTSWTISKRDVQRRRMNAEAAAAGAGQAGAAGAAVPPPQQQQELHPVAASPGGGGGGSGSLGRGLLHRFNAAWARSRQVKLLCVGYNLPVHPDPLLLGHRNVWCGLYPGLKGVSSLRAGVGGRA